MSAVGAPSPRPAVSLAGLRILPDSAWSAISIPGHDSNRICQACAWDPVHDKIYMYGGTPNGRTGTEVAFLDRYDPNWDTWERLADMSASRFWIKGIYCRGKLYALGGFCSSGGMTACEAYDIANGTWSSVADMPFANFAYCAVTWRDSLIYLVGGMGDGSGTNRAVVYNPAADSWLPATSPPETLYQTDACLIGDTIYATGSLHSTHIIKGGINPDNPLEITWAEGPSLPCSTRFCGPTIALDGKVYFFGGFIAGSQVTPRGWIYDPRTGGFDTLPLLPAAVGTGTARSCFGVARESAGELYKLAGDDRGNWNPPNNTYFKLHIGISPHPDAGVIRIVTPGADVDSSGSVTPTAIVKNYGRTTVGFGVQMRIGDQYADRESTDLAPGETALVSFAPWAVECPPDRYAVACSTKLTGDEQPDNDAVIETTNVHGFEAGLTAVNLPDTMVESTFIPVASVQNYRSIPGWVMVIWCTFRDETLLVYAHR
ncbi:MAG: kelch repeat-containing protein, partial [candidate division WOR-3 bacterium]